MWTTVFGQDSQRLPRPVRQEDLNRFFATIDDGRDRAMFLLMLRCGFRISEVAELLLADLYLDEPRPRIVAHGKGSRERSVYVSPQAERALSDYLAERPALPSDYVFLSYQGAGERLGQGQHLDLRSSCFSLPNTIKEPALGTTVESVVFGI